MMDNTRANDSKPTTEAALAHRVGRRTEGKKIECEGAWEGSPEGTRRRNGAGQPGSRLLVLAVILMSTFAVATASSSGVELSRRQGCYPAHEPSYEGEMTEIQCPGFGGASVSQNGVKTANLLSEVIVFVAEKGGTFLKWVLRGKKAYDNMPRNLKDKIEYAPSSPNPPGSSPAPNDGGQGDANFNNGSQDQDQGNGWMLW